MLLQPPPQVFFIVNRENPLQLPVERPHHAAVTYFASRLEALVRYDDSVHFPL